MLCFAYGSNMSRARLQARLASVRFVTVASLPGHRLNFHKVGCDGSAKCDAEATGRAGDCVIGVVYEIDEADKSVLDRIEGLGVGYRDKTVEVLTAQGDTLTATLYVATRVDPALKPYSWYRHHVLVGAREHGLPSAYIARIEAVAVCEDPDRERHHRELAIHR
ncbi:MAG: gamma-glutamylcyclotransferase family protein [Marinobacter sp.]|uniref:gamma-glutamylcyclotransferase family protein n=1 Tax=Marinobacter sp. TaxID=50741 RepID=UPI00299E4D2A|nr:gamma-glutamylcyclotransferase family protein [Marinobacter sp.]MDX1756020.1 gamma-glutamylcyclotransferase family protein [Marinobacter sp.]